MPSGGGCQLKSVDTLANFVSSGSIFKSRAASAAIGRADLLRAVSNEASLISTEDWLEIRED